MLRRKSYARHGHGVLGNAKSRHQLGLIAGPCRPHPHGAVVGAGRQQRAENVRRPGHASQRRLMRLRAAPRVASVDVASRAHARMTRCRGNAHLPRCAAAPGVAVTLEHVQLVALVCSHASAARLVVRGGHHAAAGRKRRGLAALRSAERQTWQARGAEIAQARRTSPRSICRNKQRSSGSARETAWPYVVRRSLAPSSLAFWRRTFSARWPYYSPC